MSKPLAEIHLSVHEDDINSTPMIISGNGQELATLLIIAFAESDRFFEVTSAALETFSKNKEQIKQIYSNR
jgi:hypothetical protein